MPIGKMMSNAPISIVLNAPIGETLWYASGLIASIGTIVFMVIEEIRKSCWWIKWRG